MPLRLSHLLSYIFSLKFGPSHILVVHFPHMWSGSSFSPIFLIPFFVLDWSYIFSYFNRTARNRHTGQWSLVTLTCAPKECTYILQRPDFDQWGHFRFDHWATCANFWRRDIDTVGWSCHQISCTRIIMIIIYHSIAVARLKTTKTHKQQQTYILRFYTVNCLTCMMQYSSVLLFRIRNIAEQYYSDDKFQIRIWVEIFITNLRWLLPIRLTIKAMIPCKGVDCLHYITCCIYCIV